MILFVYSRRKAFLRRHRVYASRKPREILEDQRWAGSLLGGIEFSPHLRTSELILHAIATNRALRWTRKVAGHSRRTKVDLVRDPLLTASNMYRHSVPVCSHLRWQNVGASAALHNVRCTPEQSGSWYNKTWNSHDLKFISLFTSHISYINISIKYFYQPT